MASDDFQWINGELKPLKPESPMIFMGKSMVSGEDFPLNQSVEICNIFLVILVTLFFEIGSVNPGKREVTGL